MSVESVPLLDSCVVLEVDGEVDHANVGKLTAALDGVDLGSVTLLVVDLEQVGFFDLAGLNAILRLAEDCEGAGVHLTVITPRGSANRVFTLTRANLRLDLVEPAVGSGR